MDFGKALDALKQGKLVRRSGWNGKGMFLYLVEGTIIDRVGLRGAAKIADNKYHENEIIDDARHGSRSGHRSVLLANISAHIDMRAADGTIVVGWSASQADMLSNDWEVL